MKTSLANLKIESFFGGISGLESKTNQMKKFQQENHRAEDFMKFICMMAKLEFGYTLNSTDQTYQNDSFALRDNEAYEFQIAYDRFNRNDLFGVYCLLNFIKKKGLQAKLYRTVSKEQPLLMKIRSYSSDAFSDAPIVVKDFLLADAIPFGSVKKLNLKKKNGDSTRIYMNCIIANENPYINFFFEREVSSDNDMMFEMKDIIVAEEILNGEENSFFKNLKETINSSEFSDELFELFLDTMVSHGKGLRECTMLFFLPVIYNFVEKLYDIEF